jgi:hypothetical protein
MGLASIIPGVVDEQVHVGACRGGRVDVLVLCDVEFDRHESRVCDSDRGGVAGTLIDLRSAGREQCVRIGFS